MLGIFINICREIQNLIKLGHKCCALFVKTSVDLIVSGDVKSPQNLSVRVKWYQAAGIAEMVQVLHEKATVLCYTCITCLVWNNLHTILKSFNFVVILLVYEY